MMIVKSRATFLLFVSTTLTISLFLHLIVNPSETDGKEAENNEQEKTFAQPSPLELTVHLKRVYLDGVESEETIQETVLALEDFWAKYDEWQLVDMDEERLIFQQKVDDISPLLKMNGFFGLTEDGTLSLFNGKPEELDVIQSFFQIDIEKLESKQHRQLQYGIPIQSKEDFSKVYEAMKRYAIEKL